MSTVAGTRVERLARKDAVKKLVTAYDDTLAFWMGEPPKTVDPNWRIAVTLSHAEWTQIIDAIRPISHD